MDSLSTSVIEHSSQSTMPDSQDVAASTHQIEGSCSVVDASGPVPVISSVTDETDSKTEDKDKDNTSEQYHQSDILQQRTEDTAVVGNMSLDTSENLQGSEESGEVSLTITDVRSLENELCPDENNPQAFVFSESDVQEVEDRQEDEVDIQSKRVSEDKTSTETVGKNDFDETVVTNVENSVSVCTKNVHVHVICENPKPVDENPVEQEELLMITDVRSLSEERHDECHTSEQQTQQCTDFGQPETGKDHEGVNETKGGKMEDSGGTNYEMKDSLDQQRKQHEDTAEISGNDRTVGMNGSAVEVCETHTSTADAVKPFIPVITDTQTASMSMSGNNGLPVIVPDSCQTLTCTEPPTSTSFSSDTIQSNEEMTSVTTTTSVCTVITTAACSFPSTTTEENSLPVISGVFSIKQEPVDYDSYGGVSSNTSMVSATTQAGNSRASISSVINKLHGKQVRQPAATASNAKTVVVGSVPNYNSMTQFHKTSHENLASNRNQIKYVFPNNLQKLPALNSNNPRIVQLNTLDGMQKMVMTSIGNQRAMPVHPRHVARVTSTAGHLPPFRNNFTPVNKTLPQAVKVMYSAPQPKRIMTDYNRRFILPRSQTVSVRPARPAQPSVTLPTPVSVKAKPAAGVCNEPEDSSSFMNIKTVGVGKITQLISRKNPIPMFKPSPVPDNLKETSSKKTFPCHECGDSFYFEKSLKIHINRCSMRLNYKCTKCDSQLKFTNKCQLLNHLRSHFDIETTQAVPIHIKSDSINIKTVYDEIGEDKKFEWYDEQNCQVVESSEQCVVCGTTFENVAKKIQHFSLCDKDVPHKCDKCYMCLPNKCSLELHRKLHTIMKNGVVSEDLICPECGFFFPREETEKFCRHMELHCFHMSRLWLWSCPKCYHICDNEDEIQKHLLASLENYYKCVDCPMALKTIQSFFAHYRQKHGKMTEPTDHVKMIYRCHLCDTLIDDRRFLITHLEEHSKKYLQSGCFIFSCRICCKRADSATQMKTHYGVCHSRFSYTPGECFVCQTSYDNAIELFLHTMVFHQELATTGQARAQFCKCGLVCTTDKMLSAHSCHHEMMMKKKFKCPICHLTFTSTEGKNNHIQYHKLKQEFICVACNKIHFKDYQDLRNHEIACVASKRMADKGDKDGGKTGSVIKELKITGNKQKVKAKKVVKEITVSEDSDDSEGDGDKNFGKVRLNLKGLDQEKRYVDKGETFKCDKCSQTFTRLSKLNDHKDAEHGLHPCHLCGMLYQSQSKLKMHLFVSHKGMRPVYYCWVCRSRKIEKSYSDIPTLERHLGQKHRLKTWDKTKIVAEWPDTELKGVSPEPRPTLKQDSTSEDEPPMKKLKVEGESEFKCAKCVFRCESKQDFHTHIAGHHTENSVQCLECGLCFTVMPSLQRHLFMVHKLRDFTTYVKENNIEAPKEMESLEFIEREEIVPEPPEESSEEEAGNPMECKVCYIEFDSEYAFKKHARSHGMAFIKRSRRRNAHSNSVSRATKETEPMVDVCVGGNDGESPCKKLKQDSARSSTDTEDTPAIVNGDGSENSGNETLKIKLSLSDRNENGKDPLKWSVIETK